jgi:hypothetical protein
MEIIQLEGEDPRLYELVAHLVMRKDVLSYNLNYPYRTSPDFCWFIALDQGNALGFIPVKVKSGKAQINNYYIKDDDSGVFSALLQRAVSTLSPDSEMESVTQTRHIPAFEKNGFSVILQWTRYAKMKLSRDEKKCL